MGDIDEGDFRPGKSWQRPSIDFRTFCGNLGFIFNAVKILGSTEDLTAAANVERQTKLRDRLKKFFHRRPTMESIKQIGIYKGSYFCGGSRVGRVTGDA